MQKHLWRIDSLFVGGAILLTIGGTVLAKPADMKAIATNGGAAGLSALGIVTWVRWRNRQTQSMLRQDLRSHLQNEINIARRLLTKEVKQATHPENQRSKELEQIQTELNRIRSQFNSQLQATQARTQSLEAQLAKLQTLQHQTQKPVESPRVRVSQDANVEPPSSIPNIPKPIKRPQAIEQFQSKQTEVVIQWLAQHQIQVAPPPPPIEHVDEHYNHLALYLGDHYPVLKDLHAYMKRTLHSPNQQRSFWFDPRSMSDTDFRICAKFCQELKRAFLVAGDFRLNPRRTLKGKLAEDGVLRGFLDGKWFERFVYQKMTQILTDKGLDHACLLNAKILSGGRTEAELDMVFLIEGQPICIECKSGQYQQEDARKFAQYAERLGLAKPCAIFVVLEDYAPDIELQKPQMTTITMTTSSQLGTTLEIALQSMETPGAEIGEELTAEPKVTTEPATRTLNQLKARHRPIPQHRAVVWQGLIALFSSERPPEILNFVTLKSLLAERVGISKNQINGVLLLLRNAGYFWDQQNSPVMLVGEPIFSLRSLNQADIERTFVEEYVKNVLRIDWNFFDEIAQCQQFSAVIGAEVPDEEMLERLKQELSEGEDENEHGI